MIDAIISGGQTGADQGGLNAAQILNIGSGGYAPKGWITEKGPMPILEQFGLVETDTDNYSQRTRLNVKLADATVIFGRRSRGSNLTEEVCRTEGKPCCWIMMPVHETLASKGTYYSPSNPIAFRLWLKRNNVKILNCAGNRESVNPGIGESVKSFLIKALGGK